MRAAFLAGLLCFACGSFGVAQAVGTLDPSFGQGGKVVTSFTGSPTDVKQDSTGGVERRAQLGAVESRYRVG